MFGGPAKGGTFRPFWSPTLGGGTHAIRRRRPSPARPAERAGSHRPRPARATCRRGQHEPRRQPGVRRRRELRRHLYERLHRALQPRNDRGRPRRMVLQYTSASGTGNFGCRDESQSRSCRRSMLRPGQYVLVQEASGAAMGSPLPTPDVTDATPINMAEPARERSRWSRDHDDSRLQRRLDAVRRGAAGTHRRPRRLRRTRTSSRAPARPRGHPIRPRRYGMDGGCADTDNNAADFTVGDADAAEHGDRRSLRRRCGTVRDVHDTCERRHRCGARRGPHDRVLGERQRHRFLVHDLVRRRAARTPRSSAAGRRASR